MKFLNVSAIFTLLSIGNLSANAQVRMARNDGVDNSYIVTLKKSAEPKQFMKKKMGASVANDASTRVFNSINAFVANMSHQEAEKLSQSKYVKLVEQNAKVSIKTDRWGLDRIDQEDLPLDDTYTAPANGGEGVTAYIVDTGIEVDHEDFEGRASQAADFIDSPGQTDCNGHGTHVAGTVGGLVSGVANKVTLKDIRVLDCGGSGTWAGVIGGINWIAENHDTVDDGPATVNMSLGGGFSQTINDAVAALVGKGITVVVAAGNSNTDACNSSPASEPTAVTVGSTTKADARSSFSNYGTCLDIYAPGSDIKSAWIGGGYDTISGTSMASPHVCGVTALYLSANNDMTTDEVVERLSSNAVNDKVEDAKPSSPNKLLNIGDFSPTVSPSPTIAPTTLSPTITSAPTSKCRDFEFEFFTDDWPEDNSWELRSTVSDEVILSRDSAYYVDLGANKKDIVSECVVPQCMKFTIFDSYDDGIWTGSYYKTSWDKKIVLQRTGKTGENWSSESVEFGCDDVSSPTASPTDAPTTSPTVATECPSGESLLKIELKGNAVSKKENKYIVKMGNADGQFKKTVVNVKSKELKNNGLHVKEKCVKNNSCFRFQLSDSGNNGLCCEEGDGYYRVTLGGVQLQYSIFQNGRKAQFFFNDINSEACQEMK